MRRCRPLFVIALLASAGSIVPAHAAPANDNLANAVLVTAHPYRNTRSTVGATRQTGEASTSCGTPQATVWYEIKLRAATDVAITTTGSSYDTVLVLWRGTARTFSSLTYLDCVNDLGTQRLAAIGFEAAANVRYFLQVGSGASNGVAGALKLRITTGRQILIPETGTPSSPFVGASAHARIIVATDSSGTEIIGRERVQACPIGFCFPLVDVGEEGGDKPAPAAHGCVTAVFFAYYCAGPEPGR